MMKSNVSKYGSSMYVKPTFVPLILANNEHVVFELVKSFCDTNVISLSNLREVKVIVKILIPIINANEYIILPHLFKIVTFISSLLPPISLRQVKHI